MFNFFKGPKSQKELNVIDDEAVIITINFDGVDNFGTDSDRNAIFEIEEKLKLSIPPRSQVDGHDIGDGEAIIYIYGPSADSILDAVKSVLIESPFNRVDIALRYGRVDDPAAKEKRFSLSMSK